MSLDLRDSLRLAAPPFVATKALSFGVGWLTIWRASRLPGLPSWDQFRAAFSTWDGQSYLSIADHGYPGGPLDPRSGASGHLWAYFPGLPLAVHAVGFVVIDAVAAALLINAICSLVALAYLARLVELERRDVAAAQAATWALALYPYAIFLTVFYTEAPFIAAATAALFYMRRGGEGDHVRACVLGMLATTTRVTGLALLPAILLERVLRHRRLVDPQLLLAGLVALPVGLFMIYARARTGDALAWFHIEASQSFGGRSLDWPWNGLTVTWDNATSLPPDRNGFVFVLEAVFGVVGLSILAVLWVMTTWRSQRIAPSLAVYSTCVLLPPLCLTYWLSVPRYLMSMVPMYILAADALRGREGWRMTSIAVGGGLMSFGTYILTSGAFLA